LDVQGTGLIPLPLPGSTYDPNTGQESRAVAGNPRDAAVIFDP